MTGNPQTDLTFDASLACLMASLTPLGETEHRRLESCLGAILAGDIISASDFPLADTAAVDGYAFSHAAFQAGGEKPLKVEATIRAGHPLAGAAIAGSAYRIATGAVMPYVADESACFDTVAMQEDCVLSHDADGEWVLPPSTLAAGSNFRPAGENLRKGEFALAGGSRLGAAEIGLAAAMGMGVLPVARRLAVAVLSTGDELREPGDEPIAASGMIADSNRPMLAALLAEGDHVRVDGGIIPDRPDALVERLALVLERSDAAIITGGSSEGSGDYAKAAIADLGGRVVFSRVKIKPGRPFAFGLVGGKPVFCIPGNPVAVYVIYRLLVAPALEKLSGAHYRPPLRLPVISGFSARHKRGRVDFVRVHLERRKDGEVVAMPHGRPGAGVLTSLTGADALLEISADQDDLGIDDRCMMIPLNGL